MCTRQSSGHKLLMGVMGATRKRRRPKQGGNRAAMEVGEKTACARLRAKVTPTVTHLPTLLDEDRRAERSQELEE